MNKDFYFEGIDYRHTGKYDHKLVVNVELVRGKNGRFEFSCTGALFKEITDGCISMGQILGNFNGLIHDIKFDIIHGLWVRNHLNYYHSGDRKQSYFLYRAMDNGEVGNSFEEIRAFLKKNNLQYAIQKGKIYEYGETNIYWEIVEEDMVAIENLLGVKREDIL